MARLPRFLVPNYPQHVIQRGNNRVAIFNRPKDYQVYLEKLCEASQEYACKIHAYVLMTNHVHLLVKPSHESSISKMQQAVGRYYVQYFNYCYKRTGTRWEGRYRATLVENEYYLLACMRYIEMNPVRAKIVLGPDEYPWSSFHYNALGQANALITPHAEYEALGKTYHARQQSYAKTFEILPSTADITKIREMTNKGWVLGSEAFKQEIQNRIPRPTQASRKGGDRKSQAFRDQKSMGSDSIDSIKLQCMMLIIFR